LAKFDEGPLSQRAFRFEGHYADSDQPSADDRRAVELRFGLPKNNNGSIFVFLRSQSLTPPIRERSHNPCSKIGGNAMMLDVLPADPAGPTFPLCQLLRIAPIRILHVDDEPDICELVELSLGLEPDFVTRSCGSGKQALAVAADWGPDLILLDVIMPGMGGVATLARLRIDAKSRVPIVFLTGLRRADEPKYYRSLGAAGVIFKPFEPGTLAASVRKYLYR
jgi:CheY-like chemotaxis protein